MYSKPSRVAIAAAALVVVGSVSGAQAASSAGPKTLVVTDPAGDKIAPALSGDVAKVTFTTKGKGSGKSYKPKALIIIMQLNDSLSTSGSTEYAVDANIAGCGHLSVYTAPGSVVNFDGGSLGCGTSRNIAPLEPLGTFIPLQPQIVTAGKTITFTIFFDENPEVLKAGASITDIHAFTAAVDPVSGAVGLPLLTLYAPSLANSAFYVDEAASKATYRIG